MVSFMAEPVISQEHERIHSKKGWLVTRKHAALADEASSDIAFTTGANKYPHLRKYVANATGGPLDGFLYEVSSISGGTGMTERNCCRPGTTDGSSGVTWVHTPTVASAGTEIEYVLLPTLTAIGSNVGGVTGADIGEEWVLKPETTYLLRLTNNSGGAVDVGWHIFYYFED